MEIFWEVNHKMIQFVAMHELLPGHIAGPAEFARFDKLVEGPPKVISAGDALRNAKKVCALAEELAAEGMPGLKYLLKKNPFLSAVGVIIPITHRVDTTRIDRDRISDQIANILQSTRERWEREKELPPI